MFSRPIEFPAILKLMIVATVWSVFFSASFAAPEQDADPDLQRLKELNDQYSSKFSEIEAEKDKQRKLGLLRYYRADLAAALTQARSRISDVSLELIKNQAEKNVAESKLAAGDVPALKARIDRINIIIRNAEFELEKSKAKEPQAEGDRAFQAGQEILISEKKAELAEAQAGFDAAPNLKIRLEFLQAKNASLENLRRNLDREVAKGNTEFFKIEELSSQALNISLADQQ